MLSNTKILTSQKKQAVKINQKYCEYFLDERLSFFRLLTFIISIASFVALLFFIIQEQGIVLIISVTMICIIYLILTFFSHKFKNYLVHILASMYMFSVATTSIIIVYGTEVPQFLFGFSTGIIFSIMIQFCNPRAKYLFMITTPWIYLTFSKNFSLSYLHYILYDIIACTLLGFFSHLYNSKQKQIFNQSDKIKQQLEIIRHFTNDYLFAISYDGKQRQFKLEFSNLSFENSHPEDIKEYLRLYKVLNDPDSQNQKKTTKIETLEEFLFELYKKHEDLETNQYFDLKVKNKLNKKLFEMKVSRTFIQQQIFVLAIKATEAAIHFEKYENRIINLKESLTSMLAESGSYLQLTYKSLNKVRTSNCVNIQDICEKQQSNILYLLNRMKNYLIYYQREKLQLLSQTIECYTSYQTKIIFQQFLLLIKLIVCQSIQTFNLFKCITKLFLYQMFVKEQNIYQPQIIKF